MTHSIGIDIGASKVIFVLLQGRKLVKKAKFPTPTRLKDLINLLAEKTKELKAACRISKQGTVVGIGVPGVLDRERKIVLTCPNLQYLNNFPLAEVLQKKLKTKVIIENDANCFALAEAVLGAGKGKNSVFGITLGSGVGGGMAIKIQNPKPKSQNYEIFRGAFGGAAEPGHMTIKFDGPKCECGNFGCFEQYCSEKFFKRKKLFSKTLQERANKGDDKAQEIFKEYGKYLGIAIANIVNLFEPEIIVIGGGISKATNLFLKQAAGEAEKRIVSPFAKKHFQIKLAKLADQAGAIGAGLLTQNSGTRSSAP